jgi:hypothetical protein
VAAVLADHASVVEDGHGVEGLAYYAIGTTGFFPGHAFRPSGCGVGMGGL